MKVSLVSTVLNDVAGLVEFFKWLKSSTYSPEEVIIVDGGSNDGTWELLQSKVTSAKHTTIPRVIALQKAGCNVAEGRNLAIEKANNEIIATTDIGCEWDVKWLESLVSPFDDSSQIELVCGSWQVNPERLRGDWAWTEFAIKGERTVLTSQRNCSSSRSIAFKKSTWKALGKYPEDLSLAADDVVFHYLAEKAGVHRLNSSEIHCFWHRHKKLTSFFKEEFRYGRGEGEAALNRRGAFLIGGRLLLELLGLSGGFIFFRTNPAMAAALLAIAVASFLARLWPLRTAARFLTKRKISFPWTRLIIFTYGNKIYWLWGYIRGSWRGWFRCQNCRQRLRTMNPQTYRSPQVDP